MGTNTYRFLNRSIRGAPVLQHLEGRTMVVAQDPKETEGMDGEILSEVDREATPQEGDVRNLQKHCYL